MRKPVTTVIIHKDKYRFFYKIVCVGTDFFLLEHREQKIKQQKFVV